MSEITVTKQNFESEVIRSDKPVLLDFWAVWCGPCRMLAPVIAELADKYEGKIKVGKINVDDEPDLANAFHVNSIPMLAVMKNGKVTNTTVGYKTIDQLEALLKQP